MPREKILIGWTTVNSATAANKLAAGLVAARLAACVQVDGPVASHYIWKSKPERTREWRIWVKFSAKQAKAVETWLKKNHPYSTPQWLAVEAATVAEPYRKWILKNTHKARSAKKK